MNDASTSNMYKNIGYFDHPIKMEVFTPINL